MKRLLAYLILAVSLTILTYSVCDASENRDQIANEKNRKAPTVIYEQSFVAKTGVAGSGAFFSNIGGQVAADQFRLPVGAAITGISWYGIYCNTDLQSNVKSINFLIGFYRDNKGLPGEELCHKTVKAQVLDTEQRITEQGFYNGRKIYKFTADRNYFSVKANEIIWISIAEVQHRNLRSTENGWIWQWLWCFSSSKAGDTKANCNIYPGKAPVCQLSTVLGQLAFSLRGFEDQTK